VRQLTPQLRPSNHQGQLPAPLAALAQLAVACERPGCGSTLVQRSCVLEKRFCLLMCLMCVNENRECGLCSKRRTSSFATESTFLFFSKFCKEGHVVLSFSNSLDSTKLDSVNLLGHGAVLLRRLRVVRRAVRRRRRRRRGIQVSCSRFQQ